MAPPALKQRGSTSRALAHQRGGGDRDPKGNSLWLLPSGPDQVGEAFARDLQEGIWPGPEAESRPPASPPEIGIERLAH